jgi:hypothetical protein
VISPELNSSFAESSMPVFWATSEAKDATDNLSLASPRPMRKTKAGVAQAMSMNRGFEHQKVPYGLTPLERNVGLRRLHGIFHRSLPPNDDSKGAPRCRQKLRVSASRRSQLIGSTLAAHAVRDLPLPTTGEGAILSPTTTPNPENVG